MKKTPQFDKFFLVVSCAVLLACFVYSIVFSDDINAYENRPANKLESFSVREYLDGSWQNGMEDALMDQMPLSETLKRLYNNTATTIHALLMEPVLGDKPERYISFRGLYFYGGDYLCYEPQKVEELQSGLDSRIRNLNEVIAANPDVEFFLYYIERDSDNNFETGETAGIREYLFSRMDLPQDRMDYLKVPDFETYSRYFYRTDHHWNHAGAYAGYLDAAKLLGAEEVLAPLETMTAVNTFAGTKAAKAGTDVLQEPFHAYRFDLPEMTVTVNGQVVDILGVPFEHYYDANVWPGYTAYYGYDEGEVVYDTGKEDRENLLVLGNSYDNAILMLLASHFGRTHGVDLRHYETDMGMAFDFDAYLREHDIDRVLLIGDSSYFSGDLFMMGGA